MKPVIQKFLIFKIEIAAWNTYQYLFTNDNIKNQALHNICEYDTHCFSELKETK